MKISRLLMMAMAVAMLSLPSCHKDEPDPDPDPTPTPTTPTTPTTTQEASGYTVSPGYWAPVVRNVTVNGVEKLRMYYCIVFDNYIETGAPSSSTFDGSWTERALIGMCETTDPASGNWEDKGFVTGSSSDKGMDGYSRSSTSDWDAYFYYNAIDPTYIVNPLGDGKDYLVHGSWHSGFALLEIDHETGKPVNDLGEPWADNASDLTVRYGTRIGTRTSGSRWQGSEAPELIYKDGFFYLFMAYDALAVPYNTRVVRASSIEGPYYDITGRNFTNGRGDCYPIVTHPYKFTNGTGWNSYGWVGVSHCAVFKENGGDDWFYMSQGRFPENVGSNAYSNALMMGQVRKIVWCPASADDLTDLWPIALPERYAAVPDFGKVTADSLAGTWEHIDLKYQYGVQDVASDLVLSADGKMSGALTGTWSYDEDSHYLTLKRSSGDPVVVVVEREVDWEVSPRVPTLVYAGTQKSLNSTWWGKKVANADGSAIVSKTTDSWSAPKGVQYNDNYTSRAGWANHDEWGLANTHDPSVAYYNGYYYMWGTDASYGNEHLNATSGKHFPGKRSADLVDWEYVPGPMDHEPQWAVDTLNAIRDRMGLKSIKRSW